MINMLRTYLRALLKSERGATAVEYGIMVGPDRRLLRSIGAVTAVEYGIMVALIAVVIIGAVTLSERA